MLEAIISSEPESLSSSNPSAVKKTKSEHKTTRSKAIKGHRLHSWWGLIIFRMGNKIKCQTYRQTVTRDHSLETIGVVLSPVVYKLAKNSQSY